MRRTTRAQHAATAAAKTNNGKKPVTDKRATRSTTKPAPIYQDVTLAIDLGSSGIRACLMPPEGPEKVLMIHNSAHGNDSFTFSANGCVFGPVRPDDDKIYSENVDSDGQELVALKYAFYILAGAKQTLLNEYPLIDKLKAEVDKNPAEMIERLRLGLLQMFHHVILKAKESIASSRNMWRIAKAIITIPSQWDLDFEKQYSAILGEAMNWTRVDSKDKIEFFFEPEGLAHFLLHSQLYLNEAIAMSEAQEQRPCLVLDFGGHSMNGCLYYVNSKRGNTLNFFAMDEPFGIGSGSEQFADRLVKACDKKWQTSTPSNPPLKPEAKAAIRRRIKELIGGWGPGKTYREERFTFVDNNDNQGIVWLSIDEIDRCWTAAYQPALDHIRRTVVWLKNQKFKNKPLIVAAGGSLLNHVLASSMEAMIKAAGFDPILKVNKQGVSHEALRNIIGILWAIFTALTVREFLNQGAGLALQMKQANLDDWDWSGYTIWYYRFHEKREFHASTKIDVKAGDRFRLMMDPFYGQDTKHKVKDSGTVQPPKVYVKRAYTFLPKLVVMPGDGELSYSVNWLGDGNDMRLHLILRFASTTNNHLTGGQTWDFKLPLYFDAGTRCLMPGKKDVPLKVAVPDLYKTLDVDGDVNMDED
ncbi:hypothetical protein B0T20DRAFT_477616 [Sordaria brevicollis]|uniref:Uncharacterized protein n=1 Tax=Sordaria brevicollis TaxID=83679 RepID=A0AAE0PGW6_SORBR|nr:hypothetical protein B0T20DRAFT_477616 [Sordaria brevicollis]